MKTSVSLAGLLVESTRDLKMLMSRRATLQREQQEAASGRWLSRSIKGELGCSFSQNLARTRRVRRLRRQPQLDRAGLHVAREEDLRVDKSRHVGAGVVAVGRQHGRLHDVEIAPVEIERGHRPA